jgi:C-terminal processing protease CtpA/Prc
MSPHVESVTDAGGAFHFERVPSGEVHVGCAANDNYGYSRITLAEGQSATVQVTIASPPVPHRGHAGLTLEEHFGEVAVATVEVGGAAERAGVVVGDAITSVDDRPVYYGTLDTIETRAAGTAAKVAITRGDKQLVVSITID